MLTVTESETETTDLDPTTETFSKYDLLEDKERIEYTIADILFYYYGPVELSVGLFGNIMAFLVFSQRSLRSSITSFLFRVMAVADSCFILSTLLPESILEVGGNSVVYSSTARCRVEAYLYFASRCYAVWILVLITLERFIGVNFPHRAKVLVTNRRIKMAAVISLVTVALLYGVIAYAGDSAIILDKDGNVINHFCSIYKKSNIARFMKIFVWLDLLCYCIGPFCIIIIANVAIIIQLVKSRRLKEIRESKGNISKTNMITGNTHTLNRNENDQEITDANQEYIESNQKTTNECREKTQESRKTGSEETTGKNKETSSKNQETTNETQGTQRDHATKRSQGTQRNQAGMTAMLLGVSFAFLIMVMPYCVVLTLRVVTTSDQLSAQLYLAYAISGVMVPMNHCINFYLYCLTGSRFRQELRKMFICICSGPLVSKTSTNMNSV